MNLKIYYIFRRLHFGN